MHPVLKYVCHDLNQRFNGQSANSDYQTANKANKIYSKCFITLTN